MNVRSRGRRFMTGPESHLASIRAVKYIPFYSGCPLALGGDSIRRGSHKPREIIHRLSPLENDLCQSLLLGMRDAQRDVLHPKLLGDFLRFTGEL